MLSALDRHKADILRWGFYIFTFALSFYVIMYALGRADILRDGPHHTTALRLIDGDALRPYIYRTLLPSLSHIITTITPEILQDALGSLAISFTQLDFLQTFFKTAKWGDYSQKMAAAPYLYPALILVLLMYGSIVAYGFMLMKISKRCFPKRLYLPYATALFGLMLLLPFIDRVFKVYDPPTLLLSALCLYYMITGKWRAYLVIFTLTCLNKETAILQTGMFAMAFVTHMPKRQFIQLLIAQIIIFALIKIGINLYYADNAGHLVKYRELWVMARASIRISGYNMLVLITLCWLLFSHWQEIPRVLRHSLWILAGLIPVYYLLGVHREYRVFFDCFPGLTVIAGYALFNKLDVPRVVNSSQ